MAFLTQSFRDTAQHFNQALEREDALYALEQLGVTELEQDASGQIYCKVNGETEKLQEVVDSIFETKTSFMLGGEKAKAKLYAGIKQQLERQTQMELFKSSHQSSNHLALDPLLEPQCFHSRLGLEFNKGLFFSAQPGSLDQVSLHDAPTTPGQNLLLLWSVFKKTATGLGHALGFVLSPFTGGEAEASPLLLAAPLAGEALAAIESYAIGTGLVLGLGATAEWILQRGGWSAPNNTFRTLENTPGIVSFRDARWLQPYGGFLPASMQWQYPISNTTYVFPSQTMPTDAGNYEGGSLNDLPQTNGILPSPNPQGLFPIGTPGFRDQRDEFSQLLNPVLPGQDLLRDRPSKDSLIYFKKKHGGSSSNDRTHGIYEGFNRKRDPGAPHTITSRLKDAQLYTHDTSKCWF